MSESAVYRCSQVEADLFKIAIHIGRHDSKTALRFLDAAEATFNKLAIMPGLGLPRKFWNVRLARLRVWKIEDFSIYRIFYQPFEDGIQVIRVLHRAQDLNPLLASMWPKI